MPNKASAKKALRQSDKKSEKNARMKKHVKTLYKNAFDAVKTQDQKKAQELAHAFQKFADKAIKTNVISQNAARRKKSRLARLAENLNKKPA